MKVSSSCKQCMQVHEIRMIHQNLTPTPIYNRSLVNVFPLTLYILQNRGHFQSTSFLTLYIVQTDHTQQGTFINPIHFVSYS